MKILGGILGVVVVVASLAGPAWAQSAVPRYGEADKDKTPSEIAAEKAPGAPAKRPGILRSSLIYSGLTLISRFMGLARDLVITARLGASLTPAADAYNTMLAFPNLFRRIFAEGAFAAAFVPSAALASRSAATLFSRAEMLSS